MTTTPTFTGFPPTTLPFLRALRDHADRDWFAAHRSDYVAAYDGPAKSLVRALADRLAELSDDLHADPVVGGSIFRVNRDRRFAPDATPYKGYIDLWFWEGHRPLAPGGLYLRITPDVVRVGAGARTLSREALARYRAALLDDVSGDGLAAIVADLDRQGVEVAGATLRGAPRGTEVDALPDTRQALLRHTALIAEDDHPAAGLVEDGDALMAMAVAHWRRAWPLHRWLVDHVQVPAGSAVGQPAAPTGS